MSIDRIDNDIGHIIGNVVPACVRCNYFRRDMPYEAWLQIVPYLQAVRESGAYGDWVGGREKRLRAKSDPATPPKARTIKKHGLSAYRYGCRCGICQDAEQEAKSRQKRARASSAASRQMPLLPSDKKSGK